MTDLVHDVFADTVFWVALVVRQDQHHHAARTWATRVSGRMVTSVAVLLETANLLGRSDWRPYAIDLINHLKERKDVEIIDLDRDLVESAWTLYCDRRDKNWGLTDCVSFVVMQQRGLLQALTADVHFVQAGFRALMLED